MKKIQTVSEQQVQKLKKKLNIKQSYFSQRMTHTCGEARVTGYYQSLAMTFYQKGVFEPCFKTNRGTILFYYYFANKKQKKKQTNE